MTKKERIAATLTGIALFCVAALFSIGLLLGLLDFGSTSSRFLPALGQMLLSVYGFCSILIPAFFFVSGAFCLSAKWNIQRAFILLVSIVPFFTLVIAEQICVVISNQDTSPLAFVKISSIIVIAVLLVILEYLLAVTLATFIENKLKDKSSDSGKADKTSEKKPASNSVSEIEWGPEYDNFPKADPKDYEDNGELSGSQETENKNTADEIPETEKNGSAKNPLSFLKNKPSELKHLFVHKISFANKKKLLKDENTEEKKSETPAENSSNKNKAVEKNSSLPAEQPEKKPAFNWSIDDEGNVKKSNKKTEAENKIQPENLQKKTETLPEKTAAVNNLKKSENIPAEEKAEKNIPSAGFNGEKTENKNSAAAENSASEKTDALTENKTKDTFDISDEEFSSLADSAPENFTAENEQANSEMNFEDADIIDQFERESESLTATIDNFDSDKNEISYDMNFEEPEESEDTAAPEIMFDSFSEKNSDDVSEEIPEELSGEIISENEDTSGDSPAEELPDDFFNDASNNPSETVAEEKNISSGKFQVQPDSEINVIEESSEPPEETFEPENDFTEASDENENSKDEIDESFMQDQIVSGIQNADKTADFNPEATGLGDIFSQMEQDAAQVVADEAKENVDPLASPVVDSNGNPVAVNSASDGSIKPKVQLPPKKKKKYGNYKIPTDLLTAYEENEYWIIDEETKQAALNLQETLKEFSIEAEITGIRKGPVVTMFEILPAPGVKLSKIVGLADNIALRLAAKAVRIVAPIPGKRAVGIEIPNRERATVSFRECIEQNRPEWKKMSVPVILGKDIQGETQIIDLVKTPHLLIAGSTGAGKSVCVNSMILSILYKKSPSDVKMILIDPKVVELKLYNNIPHLLTPVITEPKKAMQALQYCLCEMERRYAVLDSLGCRDVSSYNKKIIDQHIATEKIPYLIVVIDEFADLMATTGKQLEGVVARLCAMSRAVGIHLVLATQRPSVDVITGLIKANIPSRIAFMVAGKTDSRIIIDQVGAEKLLGKGDMLYASATDPFPVRIQGAFVSDQEVEDVVTAVKEWGEPEYIDDEIFVEDEEEDNGQISLFNDGADDPLYEKALDIVIQAGKASASYIQRRLSIGYNRAARLVELMEERGIVGPANGSKPREIIHIP